MADTVRIIAVDFNDLAGPNSRILMTPERSTLVSGLKHFIQNNYSNYSNGNLGFYLMFGNNNIELTDDKSVGQILEYYKTDIPLLGFLFTAKVVVSTGNIMSTGLTSGDLYWAQTAKSTGDHVNRYVLNEADKNKFPDSIKLNYIQLEILKEAFSKVGQQMGRNFPTEKNSFNNLIMLNGPITLYQSNFIPTVYLIGSLQNNKNPGSFDYIKGRGGWMMQYRQSYNAVGLVYLYDVLGRTWYKYENGKIDAIDRPPRPSGIYVAITDEDNAEVRQVINSLYV